MTIDEKKDYITKFNSKHSMLNTRARIGLGNQGEIVQDKFLIQLQKDKSIDKIIIHIDKYVERAYVHMGIKCSSAIIEYDGNCLESLCISMSEAKSIKVIASNTQCLHSISFYNSFNAEYIDLSNVDISHITSTDSMFSMCGKLKRIDFGNIDTKEVVSMRNMFWMCQSIEHIETDRFDTSKVTDMERMFTSCSSIIELDISNFRTKNLIKAHQMFARCYSLQKLCTKGFEVASLKEYDGMFMQCNNLREVTMPENSLNFLRANHLTFQFCSNNINFITQ